MKRIAIAITVVCCLSAWSANAATVEGPPQIYSDDAGTELAAEVEALRAELDDLWFHAAESGLGGLHHYCQCCSAPGWFAGADLAVLKPYFGGGVLFGGDLQGSPTFDYYATPRLYVGHRGPSDMGLRMRYWTFDQAADPLVLADDFGSTTTLTSALDIQTLDLEVTKVLFVSGVHWDLGAGVRYGRVESRRTFQALNEPPVPDLTGIKELDFEGLGMTFSIEGRNQIGNSNLSVVGTLRASLLVGDQDLYAESRIEEQMFQFDGSFRDKMVPIIEPQVGLEWVMPTKRGRLFLRAMIEGQWWTNAVTAVFDTGEVVMTQEVNAEDIGFIGGTLSAIYLW